MCEYAPGAAAALPGGVGISLLTVYDVEAPDGLVGGTPHVHLACSEGYCVIAGAGAVQTLTPKGYAETQLQPATVVWFDPGTIHRLVNGGGLQILTLMSNSGLPEAGDAVLRERYEAEGPSALDEFYAAAVRIVQPQLADWRKRWEQGARRLADETGAALDALEAGTAPHLQTAELHQLPAPTEFGRHGMCGRLDIYDIISREAEQ